MAFKKVTKEEEKKEVKAAEKKPVSLHEKQLARQNPVFDPSVPENKQRWFR